MVETTLRELIEAEACRLVAESRCYPERIGVLMLEKAARLRMASAQFHLLPSSVIQRWAEPMACEVLRLLSRAREKRVLEGELISCGAAEEVCFAVARDRTMVEQCIAEALGRAVGEHAARG